MDDLALQGVGMTSPRTRGRMVARLRDQGITDEAVLRVMNSVPRHIFLDEALAHRAYEDTALPIGFQQTLSQPYIVARMTELLRMKGPLDRVLEIGTGSGYQTAVLAGFVGHLYSVERIEGLQQKARERLTRLAIRNVTFRLADGTLGWPQPEPRQFDGILSAAAPEQLPSELLAQLAPGGRLVIPVGGQGTQRLQVVDRVGDKFEIADVEMVRFVPLLSGVIRQ